MLRGQGHHQDISQGYLDLHPTPLLALNVIRVGISNMNVLDGNIKTTIINTKSTFKLIRGVSVGQGYTQNIDNLGHSSHQGGQTSLTHYPSCRNFMQSSSLDYFSSVIINSRIGPTSLSGNMPSSYADWIETSSTLLVTETSLFENSCSSKMIEVEPVLKDVKLKAPEPDDEDKESLVELKMMILCLTRS